MTSKSEVVSRATMQAVVERHDGRCAVCGRACGPEDTWRHTMPPWRGSMDDPSDFSLLCQTHRDQFMARHVRPARYLFKWPRGPRVLMILSALARWVVLGVGLGGYAAFVAIEAALVWQGSQGGPFHALGCLLLGAFLFTLGVNIVLVARGQQPVSGSQRVVVVRESVR